MRNRKIPATFARYLLSPEEAAMLPTNAPAFIAFMERVWDMQIKPAAAGSVILTGSPLYNKFNDALSTAELCGMVRTGGTRRDGVDFHVYRFPNDLSTGVCIAFDGNSLTPARNRYGAHKT